MLLYEIDKIERFLEVGNFLSYARLVRCDHESAGKKKGSGGKKIGSAHLKWAFSEAACLMLRALPEAKKWLARQERKRGKRKALSILEAKIGRTVYHGASNSRSTSAASGISDMPGSRGAAGIHAGVSRHRASTRGLIAAPWTPASLSLFA